MARRASNSGRGGVKKMASAPPDQAAAAKPPIGETTTSQSREAGFPLSIEGFAAPLPGTFLNYRRMRANPTVAIARMAAAAPIKMAEWGYVEGEDQRDRPNQGGDEVVATRDIDAMIATVKSSIEPLRAMLISQAMRALDYGFQAFEKVWDKRERDGRPEFYIRKLKPLLPDCTRVLVDSTTGAFEGAENQGIRLAPNKVFWFAHDMEGTDFYGRSRHENIRGAWTVWDQLIERMGKHVAVSSVPVPMISYPPGTTDDNGTKRDNFEIARNVLSMLGRGYGVAMPNVYHKAAEDMVRGGFDPSKLQAWQISFLEPKSSILAQIVEGLRHFESLMSRGWLVPERVMLEGEHGTKAESEAHADVAIAMAQETLDDLIRCVNWYLVDQILVANYGPDARGKVKVATDPLSDDAKALVRQVITTVLTAPNNLDLLLAMLDFEAMLDQQGLPLVPGVENPLEAFVAEKERRQAELMATTAEVGSGREDEDPEGGGNTPPPNRGQRRTMSRLLGKLIGK